MLFSQDPIKATRCRKIKQKQLDCLALEICYGMKEYPQATLRLKSLH